MTGKTCRMNQVGRTCTQVLTCLLAMWGAANAGAQAPDLMFTEYTCLNTPPAPNGRFLEITNLTTNPIRIFNDGPYFLTVNFNAGAGNGTAITFQNEPIAGRLPALGFDEMSGEEIPLMPGETYVIVQFNGGLQGNATATNFSINGDDAVLLRKGTVSGPIVDSIGQVGADPGVEWGNGRTSTFASTLRRKATVCAGDVNTSNAFDPAIEWIGIHWDDWSGYTIHNGCFDGTGNVAPVVVDDGANVNEDGNVNIDFFLNDSDVDSTMLPNRMIVTPPSNGVLTFPGDALNQNDLSQLRAMNYAPNANFNGVDTFTYTVMDEFGAVSNLATVTVNVTAFNDAPVLDLTAGNFNLIGINVDEVNNPGTLVTALLGDRMTDIDQAALEGIAIDGANNTNGTWQFSLGDVNSNSMMDAGDWTNLGSPSNTMSRMLAADSDNRVRFVPNAGFNGAATFTFRGWDQTSNSDGIVAGTQTTGGTTTFSAAVGTASQRVGNLGPPVANDDNTNTVEDIAVVVSVLGNDTDPDGNETIVASSVMVTMQAASGVAVANANGTITYTPNTDFQGPTDTFKYRVSDSFAAQSNEATVTVNLSGTQDPPIFTSMPITAATEGVLYTYNCTATDPDSGAMLTLAAPTLPAWLNFVDNGSGSGTLSGTPTGAEAGQMFNVVLTVNDGIAPAVQQAFAISVTPVNDAPTLTQANLSISNKSEDDLFADARIDSLVAGAITDPDPGALAGIAIIAADSANGVWEFSLDGFAFQGVGAVNATSARLLPANSFVPKIRFNPNANYNGPATITFHAWDQTSGTAGGLGNPSVNGGQTAFSTNTAVATIMVLPVNDAPVLSATGPSLTTIDENNAAPAGTTVAAILGANVADVDAGALQGLVITGTTGANGTWQASINNGTTFFPVGNRSDASALPLRTQDLVRFLPNGVAGGNASFTFRAWDRTTGSQGTPTNASVNGGITAFSSATDTVGITVTSVNDAPTFTSVAITSATEAIAYTYNITTGDVDGDAMTISAPTRPAWLNFMDNGGGSATLSGTPGASDVGTHGVVLEVTDGIVGTPTQQSFTITVSPANGAPQFTSAPVTTGTQGVQYVYNITSSDPDGDNRTYGSTLLPAWLTLMDNGNNTATLVGTPGPGDVAGPNDVTITVTDNVAPHLPVEQSFTIVVTNVDDQPTFTSTPLTAATEDALFTYNITCDDIDGDTLTILAPTRPAWATFTDNGDGTASLTGTPANSDVGNHNVALTVSDGTGPAVPQNFTITVANVNDAPTFTSTPGLNATEDSAYTYNITTQDVDAGATLTLLAQSKPAWLNFTPVGNGNGTLTGTPTQADVGPHNVTLTVSDGIATPTIQQFIVTVAAVNDAPVANNDSANTAEETPVVIDVTANDTDEEGPVDATTVVVATAPANGATQVNATTGDVTYTPNNNFAGNDSFTYTVRDGSAQISNIATVNVTVAGTPDAPVANCQDVVAQAGAGCTAAVTPAQVNNGSFDPDGGNVSLALNPAGPYPVGVTQVTLTVTDGSNATDTCTAQITVLAADSDGDGVLDCQDGCPSDANKTAPGTCGCGVAETDSDGDGTPNCADGCPNDGNKVAPGTCGCGTPDTDSDGDGTPDCNDGCDNDPNKIGAGTCGCGTPETDSDGDGVLDCLDNCPTEPNPDQADGDNDGLGVPCDTDDPAGPQPTPGGCGECGAGVASMSPLTALCMLSAMRAGVRRNRRRK